MREDVDTGMGNERESSIQRMLLFMHRTWLKIHEFDTRWSLFPSEQQMDMRWGENRAYTLKKCSRQWTFIFIYIIFHTWK